MKLFISHAWQDKTVAHQIAESMGRTAEVWLDVNHLKAGDAIQPRIDEAMATCDVIVVVWSKSAAKSKGVKAEIETAERLSLRRLPVLIDGSKISRQPALAGLYGIDFDPADTMAGLFRIHAAIARLMMGAMGLEDAQALNALTEFEGLHQYVAEYRNRRGIAGADSLDWALKAMESCNKTFKATVGLRDRVGGTLKTLQLTLGEVQAAGNDPQRIAAILKRLRARPDAASTEFRTLIDFVQGKLDSLELAHDLDATPVRNLRGGTDDAEPAANPRLEPVLRYIQAAPVAASAFLRLALSGRSQALKAVAASLQAYLHEAQDLVPDNTHPMFGYIDDAWLIHNTIYRCIEGGLFPASQIPVDWAAVVQADAAVVALLPPPVRQQLEAMLLQSMQAIAQEQQSYQPGFVQQALMGAYAAWMGGGSAVGGSGTRERTIDDIYYGGGKMHLYTGP